MQNRIVAHLMSGAVVKGVSLDVDLLKPRCHVKTEDGVVEVQLADVKALFFVRDLAGDASRNDTQEVDPTDSRLRGTTQVEVLFHDGERIVGLTNRFPPRGQLFFMVPVDAASNNSRILVNLAAVRSVHPSTGHSAVTGR